MFTNLIGHTLLNQFRVDAFVASGGMGVVYRVWDLKRNVPLAMKVLHTDLADDPTVLKRFQREARALRKLTHPHIVPFYGLHETQDFAFLLQHFVDGPTLKWILRQRKRQPLPVEETLSYLKSLSAALGYAHANGVVHCDMKPGNVMVDQGGNIYLTDFGIARHAESTLTTMGVAGTPAYMAPEQIRGEPVSPATDVYALGVMLFELLTGQRLFLGTETSESRGATAAERTRYAHLQLAAPDPRTINPDVPEGLAQVVLKALEKDPQNRFPNPLEMIMAACAVSNLNYEQLPERVQLPETARRTKVSNAPIDPERRSGPMLPRRIGLWIGIALGSVAIFAVLTILLLYVNRSQSLASLPGTQDIEMPLPNVAATTEFASSLLTVSGSPTPLPTDTPLPPTITASPLPSSTPLPTDTPRPIPTATPRASKPMLILDQNAFCRGGPGTNFDQIWTFNAGARLDIIGKDNNKPDWWLIEFDDTRTRHSQCWIGLGTVQGNTSNVPHSNYRAEK